MKKVLDFVHECGSFFVLTVNDDFPAGRPFGAMMEHENDLYITTDDTKAVYRQLMAHPQMQILALKPGTRSWMRVSGTATECIDLAVKQKMLDSCPVLAKYHTSPDEAHFNVFRVQVVSCEFH